MTPNATFRSGKSARDENFPVGSVLIKRRYRPAIVAFYEFVRVADDIADHPSLDATEKLMRLDRLDRSLLGNVTDEAEGSKLASILREYDLSICHAQALLSAFRQDIAKRRYSDWNELIDYCSQSAMPVGRFVLDVHRESRTLWPASDALCAALQIINHLQDCSSDYRMLGRVYIPLDMLSENGICVEALAQHEASLPLRHCLNELAKRCVMLLGDSCGLAAAVSDTRLALEIAAIQALARRLLKILQRRDPLSECTHLGKAESLMIAAHGSARALIHRWMEAATTSRYQTP